MHVSTRLQVAFIDSVQLNFAHTLSNHTIRVGLNYTMMKTPIGHGKRIPLIFIRYVSASYTQASNSTIHFQRIDAVAIYN